MTKFISGLRERASNAWTKIKSAFQAAWDYIYVMLYGEEKLLQRDANANKKLLQLQV